MHRRTGISRSHISKILSGSRRPSLGTAMKLARAMGKSLDRLALELETRRAS